MMFLKNINYMKDIDKNIIAVLNQLKNTILSLDFKTAKPLIYWLNDWSEIFLKNEKNFNPKKLLNYERGMIVQAHLGFNAKSEQGGLHYCLVIDNDNDMNSNIMTVIPLSSVSRGCNLKLIHPKYEIFLGYSLMKIEIDNINNKLSNYNFLLKDKTLSQDKINNINKKINQYNRILNGLNQGTVALVSQICAISKMRIYYPKYKGDFLSDFRLDNSNLNLIDNMIKKLYTKNKKVCVNHKRKISKYNRKYCYKKY